MQVLRLFCDRDLTSRQIDRETKSKPKPTHFQNTANTIFALMHHSKQMCIHSKYGTNSMACGWRNSRNVLSHTKPIHQSMSESENVQELVGRSADTN
jgi:hypothetical protein